MKRRLLCTAFLAILPGGGARAAETDVAAPPNFVIFWCDNLGYGDVGAFGSTRHRTPNLDRMAAEGMKLTHFYSSSGVCTPSRASLMTSSYPRRVNLHQNARGGSVLQPVEPIGLNPSEVTMAEVLKDAGYATMLIGKWHLGDQPPFLPTRQGFDRYWGIPYSDDMTPREEQVWPPLPLMRGDRVIEAPAERNEMTRREAEEAIDFLEQHRDRPFFLMLSHTMPGSTRAPFASGDFRGKSANGPWGDAVEELDWCAGRVLATLAELGLDGKTLVFWTSDNGAPRRDPPQGLNLPLGGWGYTTAEGGMRIPAIARWPGRIPEGSVCAELATTMDLMPTFAALAGATVPQDRLLDGRDIRPLLFAEPGARSPHEAFFYYHIAQLQAVRSGDWKLHLPGVRRSGNRATEVAARLYDVRADPGETADRAAELPEVVARLSALAERAREDLGDEGRQGRGQRPAGWVPDPLPVLAEGVEWKGYRPVREETFERVFNGKSLEGWIGGGDPAGTEGSSGWTAEGGELRVAAKPGAPESMLRLDRSLGDFILRLQVRPAPSTETGLLLRAGPEGTGHRIPLGVEPGKDRADPLPSGRWSDLELRVEGNPARIRAWVDGALVTDFPAGEGLPAAGRIGLWVRAGSETGPDDKVPSRFRNLRIRELGPDDTFAP